MIVVVGDVSCLRRCNLSPSNFRCANFLFLKMNYTGRLLGLAPDKSVILALQRVEGLNNRQEMFNEASLEPSVPRNLRTPSRFLGVRKFRMSSTRSGKIFTLWPDTECPRKEISAWEVRMSSTRSGKIFILWPDIESPRKEISAWEVPNVFHSLRQNLWPDTKCPRKEISAWASRSLSGFKVNPAFSNPMKTSA
jgi:hypothetical protein